jgi:hypothetical protein
MNEDAGALLIAEQLKHTLDLMRAELSGLRQDLRHTQDLADHRLAQLEAQELDHEARLRAVQESATQFKFLAGLATGGGLLSIISLLRALLGG